MIDRELRERAAEILALCRAHGVKLALAESCTGGLLAAALTAIGGSSDVVERGFVTYSNESKRELLGVPAQDLEQFGAVSERVARHMAEGALAHSHADLAVSVTGIAGPSGGTEEKPVGLVHLAATRRNGETIHRHLLLGELGRDAIRRASVLNAFELIEMQLATPRLA